MTDDSPLPGTTPIAIEHHTDGCRFVVGEHPLLYCNDPVHDRHLCQRHYAICYRPPATRTAVKRTLDDKPARVNF